MPEAHTTAGRHIRPGFAPMDRCARSSLPSDCWPRSLSPATRFSPAGRPRLRPARTRRAGRRRAESRRGRLAARHRAHPALAWRGPETHASADEVALTWNPIALLSSGIVVRGLGAQRLTVESERGRRETFRCREAWRCRSRSGSRRGRREIDWRVGTSRGGIRGLAFGYAGGATEQRFPMSRSSRRWCAHRQRGARRQHAVSGHRSPRRERGRRPRGRRCGIHSCRDACRVNARRQRQGRCRAFQRPRVARAAGHGCAA